MIRIETHPTDSPLTGQCKFPKDEEEVLRPEELLQQYHEKRAALDQKIDQTLSEIQQILGIDL